MTEATARGIATLVLTLGAIWLLAGIVIVAFIRWLLPLQTTKRFGIWAKVGDE